MSIILFFYFSIKMPTSVPEYLLNTGVVDIIGVFFKSFSTNVSRVDLSYCILSHQRVYLDHKLFMFFHILL